MEEAILGPDSLDVFFLVLGKAWLACIQTCVAFLERKRKRKKKKKRGKVVMMTAWAGGLMDVVGMGRYSCGGFFAYFSIL